MAIETDKVTGPAYWASYIVNGDATGFDYYNTPSDKAGDRDKANCDRWLESLAKDGWYIVSCEGEPYFAHSSDAGQFAPLGGDIVEYVIHRHKK